MQTKKTYLRKTAYSWLKDAEVSEMLSGDFEITHPDLSHTILSFHSHEYGDSLIFWSPDGPLASLDMGDKAVQKAVELEEEIEAAYSKKQG